MAVLSWGIINQRSPLLVRFPMVQSSGSFELFSQSGIVTNKKNKVWCLNL